LKVRNILRLILQAIIKDCFGAPAEDILSMDETRTEDIPQVSNEENTFLNSPFIEEEIKKAVFQMEHNKAPGSDGFPAEFYQHFWNAIKMDLIELFQCWHVGQLELFRLNFWGIVLLPKVLEAERIQQYRPICLLNVSFKIFTKVATIRLDSMAGHMVKPTQTVFMQGRNILDGVVVLHETVHEMHTKKLEPFSKLTLKRLMIK